MANTNGVYQTVTTLSSSPNNFHRQVWGLKRVVIYEVVCLVLALDTSNLVARLAISDALPNDVAKLGMLDQAVTRGVGYRLAQLLGSVGRTRTCQGFLTLPHLRMLTLPLLLQWQ